MGILSRSILTAQSLQKTETSAIPGTFVITAKLDETSFSRLEAWRQAYFPASRNFLPAHLTLFHTLSSSQVTQLRNAWPLMSGANSLPLRFTVPKFFGHGVAIEVEAPGLHALRAQLIEVLGGNLTRQDSQPYRSHITIQNKVAAPEARALYEHFRSSFTAWEGLANALLVWRYLGGPWASDIELAFRRVNVNKVLD